MTLGMWLMIAGAIVLLIGLGVGTIVITHALNEYFKLW